MLRENSAKETAELLKNIPISGPVKAYPGVSGRAGLAAPGPYEDSESIAEIKSRLRLRFRFRFIDTAPRENFR